MSLNITNTFTWPARFSCVLAFNDSLLPSTYNITVSMVPTDDSVTNSGIGLRKMKEFINRSVQNSLVINSSHSFLPLLSQLRTNVVEIPTDPTDYCLGLILFQKLTAISYDYFHIRQLVIDSTIGDNIQYKINDYVNESENNNWWTQDSLQTNQQTTFPSWEDCGIFVSTRTPPKIIKGGRDETRYNG
jgi:hypothetical protein